MNLQKKLNSWENEGIITIYQKERIEDFEKRNVIPYLFYGLLGVALFCVGLGMIALVAANWEKIAPGVKLGAALALLSICGLAVFESFRRGKKGWFEALLILFELMLLAFLGLIMQLYQLSPDSFSPMLLWSGLSLPLWFFARRAVLPMVGLPIFFFALVNYVYVHKTLLLLWQKAEEAWPASVCVLLFLAEVLLFQLLAHFKKSNGMRCALHFWLFFNAILLIASLDLSDGLIFSTLVSILVTHNHLFIALFSISLLMTLLIVFLAKRWKISYFWPVLSILVVTGSVIHLPVVLSLVALIVLALEGYQKPNPWYISLAMLFTALRLLMFYCQIFGSLLLTGLGLLIAGVVLLLLILSGQFILKKLWNKNEK